MHEAARTAAGCAPGRSPVDSEFCEIQDSPWAPCHAQAAVQFENSAAGDQSPALLPGTRRGSTRYGGPVVQVLVQRCECKCQHRTRSFAGYQWPPSRARFNHKADEGTQRNLELGNKMQGLHGNRGPVFLRSPEPAPSETLACPWSSSYRC